MNFDIPVENSLFTKYVQPLKESRHENFRGVHSNIYRGQAGEHQKGDVNRRNIFAMKKDCKLFCDP